MKINNKEFKDWIYNDLEVLLGNDVYRENSVIDYKISFSQLECTDKNLRRKKQIEFRNDVCSFANAEGGYLFYGISEDAGMAGMLIGITLTNPDRFELDRRNELQAIQPLVPEVEFSFVRCPQGEEKVDKYIVIIYVHQGIYKPYITEEQEGTFHFYTRRGNRKQVMTYTEMRNNFLNAEMLSEEIKEFRISRLHEYSKEIKSPFALVHIIPATFKNLTDYIPMFEMSKQRKLVFEQLFNGIVFDRAVPNVDGVYFPDYYGQHDYEQLQIFNNGSVELKITMDVREKNPYTSQSKQERFLVICDFIKEVQKLIINTADMYKILERSPVMYVCITIANCKGLWNYTPNEFGWNRPTKVDRDEIFCMPVEIKNLLDEEQMNCGSDNCIKIIKYSLGLRE